jgi:hypothetical protein
MTFHIRTDGGIRGAANYDDVTCSTLEELLPIIPS